MGDIAQRKLGEEKKLDEQMRFFFEKQLVGMAITSPQKGWLKVNDKLCEMLGYTFEEFQSSTWAEMTHPEDLAADVEQFERVMQGEIDDYTLEKRFVHKNGTIVFTNLLISCVRDEDGNADSILALVEDITSRVCAEEALHEINSTLEEKIEFRTLELEETIFKLDAEISERKRMEEKLKKSEEEFRSLAQNAHDPIYRYDRECRRIYVNPAVTRLSGIPAKELLGKKSTEARLVSMEDSKKVVESIQKVLETGQCHEIEVLFTLPDGSQRYYLHNHIPEFSKDGKVERVLAIGQDITAQKELASREEMFRTLAENSPNIIMRYDVNCSRIYVNPAYFKHTGIPIELAIKSTPQDDWNRYLNMITMSASEYQERILNVIKTGVSDNFVIEWHRLSDGGYIAYDLNIVAEKNRDGIVTGALAIGHNITERKSIERRIEHMANHDALTGLPNRILAKDRVEQAILQAKRTGKNAAVLFIDLDGFKTINDSLGHSVGDAMLKMVASRLQENIRAVDTLSRQGGDEFLLILSDINDTQDIVNISEKLIQAFKQPFYVNNQIISITASVGISLYPEHGNTVEFLLQSADAAMYKAKENGKNSYCFYTQQMKHNLIGLFQMQNDMKRAIQNREFILHYQPQVDLKKNKIIGVEALIRWQHPKLGLIPPMNFISMAESTGHIVEIGEWVINEACKQAVLWHSQSIDIVVAVNISAVQFKRGNLEEIIDNALKVSGLNPKFLELELTESILIHDTEKVLETIKLIKEMGIQLSIDDFGTGYSSLAYLKRFAVDKLKIDQSFVRDVLKDSEDANIVKTIIQMAKSFNLKSIAEGVESKEVLDVICEFGCDEVQGYHFAKPMPVDEFEDYYINKFQ